MGMGIKQSINENIFGGIYSNSGYNLHYRITSLVHKISDVISATNVSSKECITDNDKIYYSDRSPKKGSIIAWDNIQPKKDTITIELGPIDWCKYLILPQAFLLEEIGGWKSYHGQTDLYGEKYDNNTTYGYEPNKDYTLKDFEKGTQLPIKIKYSYSSCYIVSNNPNKPNKGTDADKLFGGKVAIGLFGIVSSKKAPFKIVFSGLNPAKKYKLSLCTSNFNDKLRGGQILTLNGNPSLRLSQIKPVENLRISQNKLTWNKPKENDILGYNIYSASELLGKYSKENKSLITELSFACSDAKYFMVRAVKEMITPSGSYLAESQGIFAYPATTLKIKNSSLSEGVVGKQYTTASLLTNNMSAKWTLKGAIPDGLSFSEKGIISGTPSKEGDYKFSVTATNNGKSATKEFSIKIKTGITLLPPAITLSSPKSGDILTFKGKFKTKAKAVDSKGTKLKKGAFSWSSDIDGVIGKKTKLSKNIHKLTLTVSDEDGATATESVIVVVQEGKEKSSEKIKITSPSDGAAWELDTPISFGGTASDNVAVVWYSNLDGKLGSGINVSCPKLSAGLHKISMIAKDKSGAYVTTTQTVTVGD